MNSKASNLSCSKKSKHIEMVPAVLNNRRIWQKYVKLSLLKRLFQNKWAIVRRGAPAASRSKEWAPLSQPGSSQFLLIMSPSQQLYLVLGRLWLYERKTAGDSGYSSLHGTLRSSIPPARPDAAPFFIIIYRPFFPPGYSRMKIVGCMLDFGCRCYRLQHVRSLTPRAAAAVSRTDRRLTCTGTYNQGSSSLLRTISQPCGGKRIRRPPMLRFPAVRTRCRIRLGSWAIIAPPHPKARCPPRRATLSNPSQPTLLTNGG
ncbi:hypothetical protein CRG98_038870 [Punica granatum]|uniref:Uncharacterized protein n=1 Tax=Punica granatum TaxID=22663 RepID=A0A2I0I9S2_PUNGR|nr:hypothetical protein CRG98_038870 [Punica granatum]